MTQRPISGINATTSEAALSPTGVSDQVAIQAKMDTLSAGGGGYMKLNGGEYIFSASLVFKSNVSIIGEGKVVFKADREIGDLILEYSNKIENWGMENIELNGNRQRNTSAFKLSHGSRGRMVDVTIKNVGLIAAKTTPYFDSTATYTAGSQYFVNTNDLYEVLAGETVSPGDSSTDLSKVVQRNQLGETQSLPIFDTTRTYNAGDEFFYDKEMIRILPGKTFLPSDNIENPPSDTIQRFGWVGCKLGNRRENEALSVQQSFDTVVERLHFEDCELSTREAILVMNTVGLTLDKISEKNIRCAALINPYVYCENVNIKNCNANTSESFYIIDVNHCKNVKVIDSGLITSSSEPREAMIFRNVDGLNIHRADISNTTYANSVGIYIEDFLTNVDDIHDVLRYTGSVNIKDCRVDGFQDSIAFARAGSVNKANRQSNLTLDNNRCYNFKGHGIRIGRDTTKLDNTAQIIKIINNELTTGHNCTAGVMGWGQAGAEFDRVTCSGNYLNLPGGGAKDGFKFDYINNSDFFKNTVIRTGTGGDYTFPNKTNVTVDGILQM